MISRIVIPTSIATQNICSRNYLGIIKYFQTINDLKLVAEKLKDEKQELINAQEDLKNNLTKKYQSEIENMQKVIKMNLEVMIIFVV